MVGNVYMYYIYKNKSEIRSTPAESFCFIITFLFFYLLYMFLFYSLASLCLNRERGREGRFRHVHEVNSIKSLDFISVVLLSVCVCVQMCVVVALVYEPRRNKAAPAG